jgi:D-alanyl-D-alanine carboxypeptidase/D-alanyl-D-alanine-endopeptidase (penicillin-binding protein 4)
VRRTRTTAVATLALLNVCTLAAAVAVAHMLPPRLAALRIPVTAARPLVGAGQVLAPAGTPTDAAASSRAPTASGLATMLGAALPEADTGPGVGVEVADAQSGQVLYQSNAAAPATPGSTTKLVTATAALAVLGPQARFTTSVRQQGDTIVLVGGGDPTLAVNAYPSSDYPQPATLAALAASTARVLKAHGHGSVRLGYDTSLYGGPDLAPGWTDDDISTGNVTPIVSLEADQGRLTASGTFEDSDDPVNYRPRTYDPAGMTAAAFASLLQRDGIAVTGGAALLSAKATGPVIASVSSPPLAAIVEQMLQESNNVIAENLARHVAIAMGQPATFSGAATAETTELRRLGVTTPISLVDGSGLSPDDAIAPETLVRLLAVAAGTPRLSDLISGLPVAGFSGTLSAGDSDFGGIGDLDGGAARGMVRAKTGNLSTIASLAGLAYDREGTLLLFAIMTPNIPSAGLLQSAATAIDSAAAGLAACGCTG